MPKPPRCKCCAKPLAKVTRTIVFGRKEDRRSASWVDSTAKPRTREEAQRHTNDAIVSLSYFGEGEARYIDKVSTWDGESYATRHRYFCTIRCAAVFGELMAGDGWSTKTYQDAKKGDAA